MWLRFMAASLLAIVLGIGIHDHMRARDSGVGVGNLLAEPKESFEQARTLLLRLHKARLAVHANTWSMSMVGT